MRRPGYGFVREADCSTIRLKINEKNMLLTPFTIIDRLCNPYAFSKTNKDTLNEKMELYFHDFSMVPLFMEVSAHLASLPSRALAYSRDHARVLADAETRNITSKRIPLS